MSMIMENDDLVKKWLNDNLTDAEKKQFSEQEDYEFNEHLIKSAQYFSASNFYKNKDFKAFKAYYKQQKPVRKLNKFSFLLKIASVVVIGLGIYYTLFFNESGNVKTLAGEKTIIELPDNSIAELNALSEINYDVKNWNDNRTLKLDGEAYFKVEKGSTFNVKTSQGIVTVLGTQFNVKQRHNYFEVKCFEGIVNVKSNKINKRLLAGDVFLILNNKFISGKTGNKVPLWTENMSEFKAIPYSEVLSEIERQYNLQVIFKNVNTNRLFTGGFPHDNLDDALNAITLPMNLSYKLSDSNVVTIHGKENK